MLLSEKLRADVSRIRPRLHLPLPTKLPPGQGRLRGPPGVTLMKLFVFPSQKKRRNKLDCLLPASLSNLGTLLQNVLSPQFSNFHDKASVFPWQAFIA
jgi:hypothetical protein